MMIARKKESGDDGITPHSQKDLKPKLKTATRFLTTVYKESVNDIAAILCAEADGDAATLKRYLTNVRDFANILIEEI